MLCVLRIGKVRIKLCASFIGFLLGLIHCIGIVWFLYLLAIYIGHAEGMIKRKTF